MICGISSPSLTRGSRIAGIDPAKTHNGYFSIDKKTNRLKDPDVARTGDNRGQSEDPDAYDLILKDKERLLSLAEPTRFIFSHSALREGWDNPNVFVMCMLKHSENQISRRQEVGRGLRLSVDQNGDRMDNPVTVHDINVLTVVASESYKNFVDALQKEMVEALTARPRQANEEYFKGKLIEAESASIEVSSDMAAGIEFYLVQNEYVDRQKNITEKYQSARENGTLAELPEDLKPYTDQIVGLIDGVFNERQLPKMQDDRRSRRNPLNDNFHRKEFQELWGRINQKAVYRVEFEPAELIGKCISALDSHLRVTPLRYTVTAGIQRDGLTYDAVGDGKSFRENEQASYQAETVTSLVKYDLLAKLAEATQLTRQTMAEILTGIQPSVFAQFKENPEHFISDASRLIIEQKATMVIERLTYDAVAERYETDIFTASQIVQDFSRASEKLKKHVYDYALLDSDTERKFVEQLDISNEIVVYAKLPKGFAIPTPVGDYNPDWAISFKESSVRHIYFVAETKGTLSSLKLREFESTKIECARRFFERIGSSVTNDHVKYDVVTDYSRLMDVVRSA